MYFTVKIFDNVHWIGANDRRKELFENLWPLPNGVSYNSYLIKGEKNVLIDTVEAGTDDSFLVRVDSILGGEPLDYMIINHIEPDHAGEIAEVIREYPDVKVVGNAKTFEIFKAYYGDITKNLMVVKDGDKLDLGDRILEFYITPWVHWPETMMTLDTKSQTLFSGDAFGSFGAFQGGIIDTQIDFQEYRDEMRRYYSNIVGKYGNMVQRAIKKFEGVEIKRICSLHGPIWEQNIATVVDLYDKWSRYEAEDANSVIVIYASMYENTAAMADYIAVELAQNGVKDIKVYDVSKTHLSYLISEIWRAKGVVLGSCAYNTRMFPKMEHLCNEMLGCGMKDRVLGLFGSGSWIGGGVKSLKEFAEKANWQQPHEAIEMIGKPTSEVYERCAKLAKAVAEAVK